MGFKIPLLVLPRGARTVCRGLLSGALRMWVGRGRLTLETGLCIPGRHRCGSGRDGDAVGASDAKTY